MSVPTTVVAGKLTPTGIGAFVDHVPPHAPLGNPLGAGKDPITRPPPAKLPAGTAFA